MDRLRRCLRRSSAESACSGFRAKNTATCSFLARLPLPVNPMPCRSKNALSGPSADLRDCEFVRIERAATPPDRPEVVPAATASKTPPMLRKSTRDEFPGSGPHWLRRSREECAPTEPRVSSIGARDPACNQRACPVASRTSTRIEDVTRATNGPQFRSGPARPLRSCAARRREAGRASSERGGTSPALVFHRERGSRHDDLNSAPRRVCHLP